MAASLGPLPWQRAMWLQWGEQLQSNKLGHASLLCGESGVGKLHFAKNFAARLLCTTPLDDAACGQCHACEVYAAGSHPDFLQLAPAEGSQVITVDEVRRLTQFVAHTPQLGDNKVIIIVPAESLNINAANALLKSLEEPQRNTYFLLLSESVGRLPATVRSRCQIRQFAQPDTTLALNWLRQLDAQYQESDLLRVGGRPLLLLRENELVALESTLAQGLSELSQGRVQLLALADSLAKQSLSVVLAALQSYLVRLCRDVRRGNGDQQQLALAKAYGEEAILHCAQRAQVQSRVVHGGQHPNARLCIETLLIDLQSSLRQ